ncbi:MAG: hypothetical protein GY940_46240 [bacterium]|nr:hypothetical protein [bacterium]
MIRENIYLEDTTLRDGEQGPGIAFSKETKLQIHDSLVAAGVRWIEAGIPVMGGDELDYLKTLVARGSDATLIGWNRGVREDIQLSLDIGFKAVHIALPTSKLHLENRLKRDRSWLLDNAADVVKYAKDRDAFVTISAEDIGRTEIPFLQEYAVKVTEAGADRLRLSDTVGILTPELYGSLVRQIAEVTPIHLQCHTHNDFGLAVANLIAGLQAGASSFHVTVNGIGERAGMADLAQSVFLLQKLYDQDLGIDGRQLRGLSKLVSDASGHAPPPWSPVIGDNVFAHESGIHVQGMLRNVQTFEPISPEELDEERQIILGKHSGRATVSHHLEKEGIHTDDEDILQKCLDRARYKAIEQKGAVSSSQCKEIYMDIVSN